MIGAYRKKGNFSFSRKKEKLFVRKRKTLGLSLSLTYAQKFKNFNSRYFVVNNDNNKNNTVDEVK